MVIRTLRCGIELEFTQMRPPGRLYSLGSCIAAQGKAVEDRTCLFDFRQVHPFIARVRLSDVARPEDHRRDAGPRDGRRVGAVSDRMHAMAAALGVDRRTEEVDDLVG